MSAVAGSRGRRSDPMQKRIPKNPKYKDVQATIDTGASLSKHMARVEDIRTNYKYRNDEIFRRMKISTFVQLAIQVQRVADIYDEIPPTPASLAETMSTEQEIDHSRGDADGSPVPSLLYSEGDYGARSEIDTARSTLLSVARGVGELDINQPPPAPKDVFVDDTCPYLLLDIREKEEFDTCHIISATSYPKANLSKAANYESKEMLRYKNMQGKIIVIYDDDERISHVAATTLVQRGYDNLFMLSGGLKLALKLFPDSLTTGTPPPHLVPPPPKARYRPPEVQEALQKQFTMDDINSLEMYLDVVLQDHSTGTSSRLSKSSTASSRSSKASSRTATAASKIPAHLQDRPAFK